MSDFIESILQSVDIIIDKRLEDVAYDSTIICTIIDDSDKKNGKYRVSDGSVTYVAYSDQNNYKKGEQIRMSVPMGDFSQKKFIIGKYVTDSNTEPITYVSPADTVLNISGNFANGITGSILANGSVTEKELWGAALDEKIISLQSNNLYNTIVLSCNFKITPHIATNKKENIEVTDDELNKNIEENYANFGYESVEAFMQQDDPEAYRDFLLKTKVRDLLLENAVISEVESKQTLGVETTQE